MKLAAAVLVTLAACHLTKPQTMPRNAEEYSAQFAGKTPVVLKNATDHPICRLTLDRMGMFKGEALKGWHIDQIPAGGQVTVNMAPATYISFELSTCDGHFGTLDHLQIDRPMQIALVKGKNHVNGPDSVEMGLDDFSQFHSSEPAKQGCRPAGDTGALSSSECCSGGITYHSDKHPGPGHCSFPDE